MAAATGGGIRFLHPRMRIQNIRQTPRQRSTLADSLPIQNAEELVTAPAEPKPTMSANRNNKRTTYYPKRSQTLELVCESLAYKGKGLCKVADTGFVVMCGRALPGEKLIRRVTRKKDNYAEAKKVKTITPHWDNVEAPCEYASHCGGCKTQNLLYEAEVRVKEQQVHGLIVHVGKFSNEDLEYDGIMKPIVPCDIQFHYRNKVSEK